MNNLPKVVTQQRRGRASNPRLLDRKSDALPLSHRATHIHDIHVLKTESLLCPALVCAWNQNELFWSQFVLCEYWMSTSSWMTLSPLLFRNQEQADIIASAAPVHGRCITTRVILATVNKAHTFTIFLRILKLESHYPRPLIGSRIPLIP